MLIIPSSADCRVSSALPKSDSAFEHSQIAQTFLHLCPPPLVHKPILCCFEEAISGDVEDGQAFICERSGMFLATGGLGAAVGEAEGCGDLAAVRLVTEEVSFHQI